MMPVRLLICDDESLATDRLKRLLERRDDVALVGTASNGGEALEAVGRLVLDPFSATIFSSDPDTYAAIHKHVADGMPLDKAIGHVAGIAGSARGAA